MYIFHDTVMGFAALHVDEVMKAGAHLSSSNRDDFETYLQWLDWLS
jgi:hypothetical protein